MAVQTAVIHYFRADTLLATESLWGRATAPAIRALFQEERGEIVKRASVVGVARSGEGRDGGESEEEGFERGRLERSEAERRRRRRKGRGEETKTIDTVGTGKQGQSARALFAEWPIKMPTTSQAGPLIRRHVNQSWNSTLINTGFRWSCLPTYLSNDTNAIWSNTCTSVKCLLSSSGPEKCQISSNASSPLLPSFPSSSRGPIISISLCHFK